MSAVKLATLRDAWHFDVTAGVAIAAGWEQAVMIGADALCLLSGHQHRSDEERERCRKRAPDTIHNDPLLESLLKAAHEAKCQADNHDEWAVFGCGRDYTEFGHTWRSAPGYPQEILFTVIRERDCDINPWHYRVDVR